MINLIKPSDVHSRYKNSLPLIPNSSYTFLGFDFNRLMLYFAEDYDGYGKHIRALLLQRFFKKTFFFASVRMKTHSDRTKMYKELKISIEAFGGKIEENYDNMNKTNLKNNIIIIDNLQNTANFCQIDNVKKRGVKCNAAFRFLASNI